MKRTAIYIALLLVVVLGVALRASPIEQLETEEGLLFYVGDPYDHMRRVHLIARNFPALPHHNYYQGYPVGSPYLLSPGFDMMIALAARAVAPGAGPSEQLVEEVGFYSPLALAALAILAAFFLLRQFMGPWASVFGALTFAIMPAYLGSSFVSQVDNNAIEPAMAMVFFLFLYKALLGRTNARAYAVAAGLAGVLSLLMWRGASVFWVVGAAIVIAYCLARPGRAQESLRAGGYVFTVQGAVLLVIAWQEMFLFRSAISFRELSYFHALLSLFMGLGFLAALWGRKLIKKKSLLIDAGLLAAPAIIGSMLMPELARQLILAARFMFEGNPWLNEIVEYQGFIGHGGFSHTLDMLSWLFWLIPPAVLGAVYIMFRGNSWRLRATLFAAYGGAFFLATLIHQRFNIYLAVIVAIMAGLSLEYLSGQVKSRRGPAVAGIVILLLALYPAGKGAYLFSQGELTVLAKQKEIVSTMRWIRENTPETSYFHEPWVAPPEYGIMAAWDDGSWVENIARRPAVATLFGNETYGLDESVRFMLTEAQDEAFYVLKKNNVRYVVLRNIIGDLEGYARIARVDPDGYATLEQGEGGKGYWQPGARFYSMVSTRLFYNDGVHNPQAGLPLQKVDRMRLVYETLGTMNVTGLKEPPSNVKVFEFVKGAHLKVNTAPGVMVSVRLTLLTTRGREFEYTDTAVADHDGVASFTLSYPTEPAPPALGKVSAIGGYTVTDAMGRSAQLDLSEGAVLNGIGVQLTL